MEENSFLHINLSLCHFVHYIPCGLAQDWNWRSKMRKWWQTRSLRYDMAWCYTVKQVWHGLTLHSQTGMTRPDITQPNRYDTAWRYTAKQVWHGLTLHSQTGMTRPGVTQPNRYDTAWRYTAKQITTDGSSVTYCLHHQGSFAHTIRPYLDIHICKNLKSQTLRCTMGINR